MRWSLNPIRKPDAGIEYFMAMFEDITAKRDADETASANLQQMEKLNKLKSEFVSMVSHEFRSALVGIQGFSELIRDNDLEAADVKNMAGDINKDALRLNRMITEMLEFDRMEAGKIHLELKPLDINMLVEDAVEHARVTTAKHVITESLQPSLPMISGDGDRLTQVLTNLLSNAIKYSPDGGEISVRSLLAGANVEVAIRDQGLGIPPEFIGRLFGRYERYEDKHAGKIIGTGLGLAITRQIVEMHGGKISVESSVGSGSEFKFTVPVSLIDAARRLK
jgi:signal transduction histidine kinase